ncbi:HIT-like domain-containing protein [Absidia repens]|uniref:HIT-like domain-containing protein n=1 Tax=Absidia repens TaxID=90262 RepID=A0A1X2IZ79_9FUNG|nr:HIT-like domain-containing protein [Absidia repens]
MSLETLVKEVYSSAKENKNLFIFESTSSQKEANGIQFQINYVPTLAKKPTDGNNEKPINPFLNPDPALVVKEDGNYRILLNKFCVVPHHLLIITKEYQPQTLPLFPPDMLIGWKTLMNAYGPSNPGMLFYNCGPQSGASQGHKHMQIIPLVGAGVQPPIQQAVDNIENSKAGEIYTLDQLPYVHVLTPLDRKFMDESADAAVEDYLGQMFFGLLDAMFQQLRFLDDDKEATNKKPSFNFMITSQFMLLVPRRLEDGITEDGIKLSMNSLGFGGFLLAKTESEYKALQAMPNLMDLLTQVGFPRPLNHSQELHQEQQQDQEGTLAT